MVRQAEELIVAFLSCHDRMTRVKVDRREDFLLDRDVDRDLDVAHAAAALGGQARVELGDDEEAAVRAGEPDVTLDRVREAEIVAEVDRGARDDIVTCGARRVVEEAGNVPDQRLDHRPGWPHRRTGSDASSSASSSSSSSAS